MESSLDACDSKASVAVTTRNAGKSSHVAALRSLGLLHDLQEYVSTLQQTAAEQERELSKLRGEKEEAERVHKKELRAPEKQPYVQHFQSSEIADLPPRLRALFEDNKVLKEDNRRYKNRVRDADRAAAQQEQQLVNLSEQIRKLKRQVAEGAASPEMLAAEEQAREQADAATRALQKLQDAHRVLQQKLDTDARSHKQALAAAAKERHQLEQQVDELQQQLDVKDKECRAHVLAAKKAHQRLHEVKSAAAEAVAGVNAAVAKAVGEERARQKRIEDASVHLMLCLIKEGPIVSESGQQRRLQQRYEDHNAQSIDLWGQQFDQSAAAAAAPSGSSNRPGVVGNRDQAVVRIQAGARGYLARKKLKERQEQEGHATVFVQSGTKSSKQQHQPAANRQQQEALDLHASTPRNISLSPQSATGAHNGLAHTASSDCTPDVAAAVYGGESSTYLPMDLPALSAAAGNAAGSSEGASSSSSANKGPSSAGVPTARSMARQYSKSASQQSKQSRQAGSVQPKFASTVSSNSSRGAGRRSTGSTAVVPPSSSKAAR